MQRLLALGLSFVVTIVMVVSYFVDAHWDAAVVEGVENNRARLTVEKQLTPFSTRRGVLFMGDSTIESGSYNVTYPWLVAQELRGRAEVRSVHYRGFDPYHYYFLMGRVLDLEPKLVVMVVHLRTLVPSETRWSFEDIAALIPTEELGRAFALPLYRRGITIPRLLLLRSLRSSEGMGYYYFATGLRAHLARQSFGKWLMPQDHTPADSDQGFRDQHFRRYDTPLYEQHAMVQMIAAAVEMGTRRGSRMLVLVTPIPHTRLSEEGLYERKRYETRLDVLRTVVGREGGEFLDLHRSLEPHLFHDDLGHMTGKGMEHIAELLTPEIERILFER